MKVIETQGGVPVAAAGTQGAGAASDGSPVPAVERIEPAAAAERVTTEQTSEMAAAVVRSVAMAAAERGARLQALAQAVRSGGYRPSATVLAEQMLAAADLDVRLSRL